LIFFFFFGYSFFIGPKAGKQRNTVGFNNNLTASYRKLEIAEKKTKRHAIDSQPKKKMHRKNSTIQKKV
jgi:hypothetical protein